MKWSRGQLATIFFSAAVSIGFVSTYIPDIEHEGVRLAPQDEKIDAAASIFRVGGANELAPSALSDSAAPPQNATPDVDHDYKVISHIGRAKLEQALKPDMTPLQRLQYLYSAMSNATNADFKVTAERLGMAPAELVNFMQQKSLEAIGTLRTEIAQSPDSALDNLVKWRAIEQGITLAGLQPDGRVNKTYGEQMAGVLPGEIQAQKEGLYQRALEAGRQEFKVLPQDLGVKSLTEIDKFIAVAEMVMESYIKAPPPSNGAIISSDDMWADSLAEKGAEARKLQMSGWEKVTGASMQASPSMKKGLSYP